MITTDQLRDLKLEDFMQDGVNESIAQVRYDFHRQGRVNKLCLLGQQIQLKVE